MGNAACNADFIAEAFEQAFVARGFVGKEFERDGLTEGEVIGAINFTHAPLAEQSDDAITASQQATGKKSAFVQQVFGGTGRPQR
jgi:hypothetical protein